MWANRRFLRRHGIYLPGRGPGAHYQAGSDLQGEPIPDGATRRPEAWRLLVDRIAATDSRAAIISDERLSRTRRAPARRALESLQAYDVRLILAVREFAGLVASEWQQIVKMGGTAPLDEWLDRLLAGGGHRFWKTHDVHDVLRRWRVPRDHVHLLIVPPAGADRNELWRRFASIIDAPAQLPTHAARSNASLGLDETELIRRIYSSFDEAPAPPPVQQIVRGVVSRRVLAVRDGARPIRLPLACLPWIEEQAERRKAEVASSGCQIVGGLDELDLDRSRFVAHVARPDSARVLDAAEDVIDALSKRIDRWPPRRVRHLAGDTARAARTAGRRLGRPHAGGARGGPRPQVYVLIGPPSTGADRLRRLVWTNRGRLAAAGVHVAATRRPDAAGSRSRPAASVWRGLVRDAARSAHGKVLVTDTVLASAGDDVISLLLRPLEGAEVHLLYVLRDVKTLLPAAWQERVRVQPTPPWSEWLDALIAAPAAPPWWPDHDVDQVLRRWRQRGVKNVHLVLFPKVADVDGELWERLRSVVGWPASTRPELPNRAGDLGHVQVELLRRLRDRLDGRRLGHVAEFVLASDPSGSFTFPERTRPWIEANAARRWSCAADLRNNVVGDVGDLESFPGDFAAAPTGVSEEELLDAAVPLTSGLIGELAAQRTRARSAPHRRVAAALRRLA